ncbi:hypothetical protein ES703_87116 [subsurface metagenome]
MKSLKLGGTLAAIFFAYMFSLNLAIAGAPVGAIASLDPEVKRALARSLAEKDYLKLGSGDLGLKRGIAAYLWDNRDKLITLDVPKRREVDIVICLLVYQGDQRLLRFTRGMNFRELCERYLR